MTVDIPFTSAASTEVIGEIERRAGYPIPPSLLRFIKEHDGARPAPNCVNGRDQISVAKFIPADEILDTWDGVEGFPPHGIPVAEDNSGNFLYVLSDGSVFFWDHEVEDGDIKVAEDFDEFLTMLVEEKPLDLSSVRLRSVWVRPGFKPTFK